MVAGIHSGLCFVNSVPCSHWPCSCSDSWCHVCSLGGCVVCSSIASRSGAWQSNTHSIHWHNSWTMRKFAPLCCSSPSSTISYTSCFHRSCSCSDYNDCFHVNNPQESSRSEQSLADLHSLARSRSCGHRRKSPLYYNVVGLCWGPWRGYCHIVFRKKLDENTNDALAFWITQHEQVVRAILLLSLHAFLNLIDVSWFLLFWRLPTLLNCDHRPALCNLFPMSVGKQYCHWIWSCGRETIFVQVVVVLG